MMRKKKEYRIETTKETIRDLPLIRRRPILERPVLELPVPAHEPRTQNKKPVTKQETRRGVWTIEI